MTDIRVLEVKESIFKNNDERAKLLRDELTQKRVYFINVMSSPGSGKTTTLVELIKELSKSLRVGVLEADIDSSVDAQTIFNSTGAKVIQLHTGGMCHLDADMTREGFDALGINDLDMVFLENIGNLVCPAEFDTGAHMNLCILSVPEGDDKPIKYPLMFSVSDVVAINKIDTLPIFDFHMDRVKDAILSKNPKAEIFKISALKGIGISTLAAYLIQQYKKRIQ